MMKLTGVVVMLCVGVGLVGTRAFVEAANGKRGLPEKGVLTEKFNEKAKERYPTTPTKPPETPTSSLAGGPTPPKGFKNPGF